MHASDSRSNLNHVVIMVTMTKLYVNNISMAAYTDRKEWDQGLNPGAHHKNLSIFVFSFKAAVGRLLPSASLFGLSKGQWDIFLL